MMQIPNKPFYNIYEVAERWSHKVGKKITEGEVVELIDLGVVKAFLSPDQVKTNANVFPNVPELKDVYSFLSIEGKVFPSNLRHVKISIEELLRHEDDKPADITNLSRIKEQKGKPLHAREKSKLLAIVSALSELAKMPEGFSSAASVIQKQIESFGGSVSINTIVARLKDAEIELPRKK